LGQFIEKQSNPVQTQKVDSALQDDVISLIKDNIRSPVNLIFSVILNSYRGISHKANSQGEILFTSFFISYLLLDFMTSGKIIMAGIADSIEFFHREGWNKIERQLPAGRLPQFRKKVDLLLFRIHNRLQSAVQLEVTKIDEKEEEI
jgi:hypothetical protein